MKLIVISIVVVLTLSHAKHIQKGETVLDFFNNMFHPKSNSQIDKSTLSGEIRLKEQSYLSKLKIKPLFPLYSKPKSTKNTNVGQKNDKNDKNPKKTKTKQNDGKNKKDGNAKSEEEEENEEIEEVNAWFSIQDISYSNPQDFPHIPMGNGKTKQIPLDEFGTRVNDVFEEGKTTKEGFPPSPKLFYFRLKNDNLYYTSTKTDVNVLDSIEVFNIESMKQDFSIDLKPVCLTIHLKNGGVWKVCACKSETRDKLYCSLQKVLYGDKLSLDCKEGLKTKFKFPRAEIPKIITKKIQPIIVIPLPSPICNENWTYLSKGADWECTCKEGLSQSPINLPETIKTIELITRPMFKYDLVPHTNKVSTIDGQLKATEKLKIKYYLNAIRIFSPNFGKIVSPKGQVFRAEEISFHTPAEHTINGEVYDMEMQIIHYGISTGDIAKQTVLSFLFKSKPGAENKFLSSLGIRNLPNEDNPEVDLMNDLYVPNVFYDNADSNEDIRFKQFSFYQYNGSLSFPPCTERTTVYVASEPLSIGVIQLQMFKEALTKSTKLNSKHEIVEMGNEGEEIANSREIQAINNREILYYPASKHCAPVPKRHRIEGPSHYEKIKSKASEIFYVNGQNPSNIPGARVIPNSEALGKDIVQEEQAEKFLSDSK